MMVKLTMRFNIFDTIYLFVFILHNTQAKKITLQIETEDLMKLLNGIMKTDILENVAAQIEKRSKTRKFVAYNNPYHPEDDEIVNNDSSDKVDHISKVIKSDSEENTLMESKLDKENNNFIKTQDTKSAEKQSRFSEVFSDRNNKLETESNVINETSRKHIDREKLNDKHNFKIIQKRFELKKS